MKVVDKIKAIGEVCTHRNQPMDIDVIKIEKMLHKKALERVLFYDRNIMQSIEYRPCANSVLNATKNDRMQRLFRLPYIVVCHDYQYSNH